MDARRVVQLAEPQHVGNLPQADGRRAHVQPLVDRQCFLAIDAQRFVQLLGSLQHIGYLP